MRLYIFVCYRKRLGRRCHPGFGAIVILAALFDDRLSEIRPRCREADEGLNVFIASLLPVSESIGVTEVTRKFRQAHSIFRREGAASSVGCGNTDEQA